MRVSALRVCENRITPKCRLIDLGGRDLQRLLC